MFILSDSLACKHWWNFSLKLNRLYFFPNNRLHNTWRSFNPDTGASSQYVNLTIQNCIVHKCCISGRIKQSGLRLHDTKLLHYTLTPVSFWHWSIFRICWFYNAKLHSAVAERKHIHSDLVFLNWDFCVQYRERFTQCTYWIYYSIGTYIEWIFVCRFYP